MFLNIRKKTVAVLHRVSAGGTNSFGGANGSERQFSASSRMDKATSRRLIVFENIL
jgi:xylose isomerase